MSLVRFFSAESWILLRSWFVVPPLFSAVSSLISVFQRRKRKVTAKLHRGSIEPAMMFIETVGCVDCSITSLYKATRKAP